MHIKSEVFVKRKQRPSAAQIVWCMVRLPFCFRSMDVLKLNSLSLAEYDLMGAGLKLGKDILSDGVLFGLPVSACLNYNTLLSDGTFLRLFASKPPRFIVCLALYVLFIKKSKTTDFYSDWLKLLPAKFSHLPFFWSPSLQKALPLSLQSDCIEMYERLMADYEEAKKSTEFHFTWEEFKWAFGVVHTRCVKWPREITLSALFPCEGDLDYAIVPYADLFNHSSRTVTSLKIVDGNIQIVSCGPQKRDDQAFINYGTHSNAYFLLQYGFVPEVNDNDFLEVTLDQLLYVSQYSETEKQKLRDFVDTNREHFDQCYLYRNEMTECLLKLVYCVISDEEDWCMIVKCSRSELGHLTDDYHSAAAGIFGIVCQMVKHILQTDLQNCTERQFSEDVDAEQKSLFASLVPKFLHNWLSIIDSVDLLLKTNGNNLCLV